MECAHAQPPHAEPRMLRPRIAQVNVGLEHPLLDTQPDAPLTEWAVLVVGLQLREWILTLERC